MAALWGYVMRSIRCGFPARCPFLAAVLVAIVSRVVAVPLGAAVAAVVVVNMAVLQMVRWQLWWRLPFAVWGDAGGGCRSGGGGDGSGGSIAYRCGCCNRRPRRCVGLPLRVPAASCVGRTNQWPPLS